MSTTAPPAHALDADRPYPPIGWLSSGALACVVVGGIIPPEDAEKLKSLGVASVYTPKDYSFDKIMVDLVDLAERQRAATPG